MRTIEMPAGSWNEFDLTPAKKRKGQASAGNLVKAVALQEPVSRPLLADEAGEDAEFRKAQAGESNFYLVQFACSFRPVGDEPFETAAVEVRLDRADNNLTEMPKAWSLDPMVQEEEVELSRSVKLTGDLKISNTGIGTEVVESKTQTMHLPFLKAFGLMGPEPAWEFRRQETRVISGSYLFSMVVCCPVDTSVNGSVRMSVQVRRKLLGLVPYNSDFPDLRACTFRLQAAT